MKSVYMKFALFALIAGLLTACGAQPAELPTSAPTEAAAPATQAPAEPPPATDTSAPTEAPATEPPAATQPPAQEATVSFANDVLPIIQSRCVNCHGGREIEEGLDLTSYAALMNGSEHGAVVLPGDAANSELVEMILNQEMPKRGPKLTPPQVQLIADWVSQGALNN